MIDRKILKQLSDDLSGALLDLHEFKTIYVEDSKTNELLNSTAPFFFIKLYEYYWERLIMAVSRFTDPPKSKGFQNISVLVLKDYSNDLLEVNKIKLFQNIETILSLSEKIRNYRNKSISHRDKEKSILVQKKTDTI